MITKIKHWLIIKAVENPVLFQRGYKMYGIIMGKRSPTGGTVAGVKPAKKGDTTSVTE